ncbi:PepSY-associated TM helix domain-containing protein [Janthinobacterium fluminis]|uniref:PepSY-associated TM helix domain-containing protein n=1 Tax=Janthinobacterium fluminis TaxID=2987524 RepID=A0ABT5K0F9_9BURK|nr:PepSY-associated TM helix domain-containing protein [Janthinobacterium fluminis]MDC8758404.1 PepSY-associated TM helix domain-containing protein [Janthinobacterium fluminis]
MKIRSDILRIYQSLHTWVGIGAGMLLFIGFFAGALTMFKQPLDRWGSAPAQMLRPVAADKLDTLVREVLVAHPAARKGFTLHLSQHENVAAPVSWSAGAGGRELDVAGKRWQATLDASGKLQAQQQLPSLLAELIDMLHRTGGIPGTLDGEYLGGYLMGVAAIMYFLALVSGVILLLPTMIKDFFALRPGKNRKRFWLDAHNVLGIASLPFHIVISLTVVVFAFHDQFYDSLAKVVYREQPMFAPPPPPAAKPYAAVDMLPATTLIKKVQDVAPDFVITEMLFMRLESPRPMIRAAVASPRHLTHGAEAGYVMVHPYSGVVDTNMLPGKEGTWSGRVSPFFALHFGSFAGNTMRWVYFLFGISGAFLFYTGNLLWVEKRRKNQGRNPAPLSQTRATMLMAAATVGICLGSVAAVGFTIVAGKWFYASSGNINSTYMSVYYSVFLAAVAWAFWRGAARASVHLLLLCALAALAIPLTSLAAVLLPSLGLWAHGSAASVGVDVVALLCALLFLYGARRTAQRVAHGPADSVWSVEAASAQPAGAGARGQEV